MKCPKCNQGTIIEACDEFGEYSFCSNLQCGIEQIELEIIEDELVNPYETILKGDQN